jgi:hypothetical protein
LREPPPQPPRLQAPPPRPLLRPHFGKRKTQNILLVVEPFLLIGPDNWELVVVAHVDHFFNTGRTSDSSVRRKFNGLTCNKTPTGDPTIPPEVGKAKKITSLIFKRSVAIHTIMDDDDDQPQQVKIP